MNLRGKVIDIDRSRNRNRNRNRNAAVMLDR